MKSRSFLRVLVGGVGATLIAATLGIVGVGTPAVAGASPTTTVYDSTVSPLPGNVASLGFEASQTSQFGNQVSLSGAANELNNVQVTMSSWGCGTSGSWGQAFGSANACVTTPGATFSEPITLNVYSVGANNAVGGLLATDTQTFAIPYRPSASDPTQSGPAAGGCTATNGEWFDSVDGSCYNGLANNITFDFSSQGVVLPSNVIYGIAYNTSDFGAAPIGDATACHATSEGCGYDSLNVGLNDNATNTTVGSDPNPGTVYWNTSTAANYCDEGTGGTGTFRIDGAPNTASCWDGGANTGWSATGQPASGAPYYVPAVQFNATPGPSSTVVVSTPDLVTAATAPGQFVVTNETGGGGGVSIVAGPAGGPSAGSLQMSTTGTADHWDAFNFDHSGVALSSISTLSYSALTNNAPEFDPDLQLQAHLTPGGQFTTINYEPSNQTPTDTANTWQSFNVLNGLVWGTHITTTSPGGQDDPISWSAFMALFPTAVLSAVGANVGSNWQAMTGNVDAISIGTDGANGSTTTYDFSPAPVVTTQPISQTYVNGGSVSFTAAAGGNPTPTVQWQFSANSGSTWANLSGATSDTFSASGLNALENGWQVRAVFTNASGSATSNAATMTLATAPVVTTQPVSQTYVNGGSVSFTAAASGNPTPTVQWQFSANGGTSWANLSGATSDTFSASGLNALENGWQVRAVFTNSAGSATSHAATMTETSGAPVVTTQPVSQHYTNGGSVSFTSAASGTPAPTVQWQFSANSGSTWANLSGATSDTFSASGLNALENGWQVRAVFTNSAGSATSNAATMTLSS
jgi:hypothetical protein